MADLFSIIEERSTWILELRVPQEMDALLTDSIIDSVTTHVQASNGGAWVVDLSLVKYLNSAGLGLLVNVRHKIRQSRGRLALCGLSPTLIELFRSCCLEQLFTIVRTR